MAKELAAEFLSLPGKLSKTSWQLPKGMTEDQWLLCGRWLVRVEGAVQWWLGDWWAFGQDRKWGEGEKIAEEIGMDYGTLANYGSVSRAFEFSFRNENLSWSHHKHAMALEDRKRAKWLERADEKDWSANEFKAEIARTAAIQRTKQTDFDAARLGKFAVLYADPPWRYENPPMGGSNRSIENHYPTMTLEEICALPVSDVAHNDSVLFLWATSPKLWECMEVLKAWDFVCRTTAVWVKDKIGMGYYFREQHELLLVAKRGELPPPVPERRVSSVIEAPRLEHSAKPPGVYDLLDAMYPEARKIELFGRDCVGRSLWTFWGNQTREAAE